MAFFATPGLRVNGDALRSGGQRKLALPDSGPDPTDAADALLEGFRARRRELSGERRLFLAVFMGALDDLRRYPSGTKPHVAAVRWVLDESEAWPLAFRPACAALDLDPAAVRTRLLATVGTRGAA